MSMGLTESMKRALDAITAFVGQHGVVPSQQALANELQCSKTRAADLIAALEERGRITKHQGSIALGSGGVAVVVAADVASKLARFCKANDESLSAVVADAILLHLDQMEKCA